MVAHRWMRSTKLVLGAAALGVGLLGAAPAAHATDITNPAEHPDPITLTIDGQTYRDGADTLPGYDDYACTPIPNVQYDFADDEIQYYDGQGDLIKTAHWTEWSRISSYQTWVSQQHDQSPSSSTTTTSAGAATPAATSTTTTTTSTAATTPAATGPVATGPAATSPAGKTTSAAGKTVSGAPKSQRSATKTKGSATTTRRSTRTSPSSRGTTSTAPKRAASSHAKKRGTSAKHGTAATHGSAAAAPTATRTPAGATGTAPSAPTVVTSSSTPSPASTPKYKLVSDKGAAGGVADTRPIGVGILVAVFAAACLAFLFGSVRRQKLGRMAS
jgi:hypothetical protein